MLRFVDLCQILLGILVEIRQAIFAAQFDLLAVPDKRVRFSMPKRFSGHDALVERIRFDRGRRGV